MKKLVCLFFCFHLLINSTSGQNCNNIGFDNGSFGIWESTSGNVANDTDNKVLFLNEISNISAGRQEIVTLGFDPRLGTNLAIVPAGNTHSLRIGNTLVGNTFDRIKTSFVVSPDNAIFQFKFALILQDFSNHATYQKPGFNLRVTDDNGKTINCGYYDIQLLQTGTVTEGFKTYGDIQYRDWTTGAINLQDYIGKRLSVEVTVHGCTRQRHYGYAYFTAKCLQTAIKPISNCPDVDGYMTLVAPEGFMRYQWSNGAQTPIIRVKAKRGEKHTVQILPHSSFNESCDFRVEYQIPYYKAPDNRIDKTMCEGSDFLVEETNYNQTGNYVKTIRREDVCDSTVYLNLRVVPTQRTNNNFFLCEGDSVRVGRSVYTKTGIFVDTLQQVSFPCPNIVRSSVVIDEKFTATLAGSYKVAKGESVQLDPLLNGAGDYIFSWQPKDYLSCSDCRNPVATPPQSMQYAVYITTKNKKCPQTLRVSIGVDCMIHAPDAFTPNGDGLNDIFVLLANKCISQIREIVIYNRWGELLFRNQQFLASDPTQGWNGTYKGEPVPAGTYAYKLVVEYRDGEVDTQYGNVLVLR